MAVVRYAPAPLPPPFVRLEPLFNFNFFEQRSFRRLVAVLGIGSAVCLAYSAIRKRWFPTLSELGISKSRETVNNEDGFSIVNINDDDKVKDDETTGKEVQKQVEVILHQVPRGFFTPAVSPLGLKLETFLRVAKIEYKTEIITSGSDAQETPWVKVGDQEIKNPTECIKFLCKTFNVDLAADASSSRRTAARLVDTLFESKISWGIALWRWVYDNGRSMKDIQASAPTSDWILSNIKDSVSKAAHYQGMGKQTQEEVISAVTQGLIDSAAALGKHKYFLGNSPGIVDCHAFSLLSQMVWNMSGSPFEKAINQQKTLMEYVIRMRDNYWPDWKEIILQPVPSVESQPPESVDTTNANTANTTNANATNANTTNTNTTNASASEAVEDSEKSLSRSTTISETKTSDQTSGDTIPLPATKLPIAVTNNVITPSTVAEHLQNVNLTRNYSPNYIAQTQPHFPRNDYINSPNLHYIPPAKPMHPTYMQLPSNYNSPLPSQYIVNSTISPPQYPLGASAGANYNNPLAQSYAYANSNISNKPIPHNPKDIYYEDLQRATAAVMKPRSQEQDLRAKMKQSQMISNYWQ